MIFNRITFTFIIIFSLIEKNNFVSTPEKKNNIIDTLKKKYLSKNNEDNKSDLKNNNIGFKKGSQYLPSLVKNKEGGVQNIKLEDKSKKSNLQNNNFNSSYQEKKTASNSSYYSNSEPDDEWLNSILEELENDHE